MQNKTLFITLLLANLLAGQTPEQKLKMFESYDMYKINNLIEELKSIEAQKEEFISSYLLLNPETKKEFYENGKYHILKDIIDDKPVYISNDNNKSAVAVKTNLLYPGGGLGLNLEGENMTVGVWEPGGHPLPTHQEFINDDGTSRVIIGDAASANPRYHPSHVAGTVGAGGVNISAKGMAPKSSIVAYTSSSDNSETISEHLNSGMLVCNHSYGVYLYTNSGEQNVPDWYPGCYIQESVNIDNALYNNPYLLRVFSAGNAGGDSYSNGLGPGLDKITAGKTSKNSVLIANASVGVQFTPFGAYITSATLAPSSSQGPTDDGRIKPDIAARGTNVTSCDNESDSSYAAASGTSMAAPSATGTILLIQEHYNNVFGEFMKASTAKGLVCHTATDESDIEGFTAVPNPGPDPFWGWGLLNAEFAVQTISDSQSNLAIIQENTLNNGETYSTTINVSDSQKLMATICWTDRGGNSQYEILNSPTPALVNDLDLRIYDNTGAEFYPWKLDLNNLPAAVKGDNIVDIIERVEIETPAAGQYTITVSHKGNLTIPGNGPGGQGGVGPQDYSLIVTGGNMTLSTSENTLSELMIWPNPANDVINFQLPALSTNAAQLTMLDIQGRIVHDQRIITDNSMFKGQIQTSNFENGIYILNIKQAGIIITQKVIID